MIFSAGLSPAWQEILIFDRLRRGEVNRAVESHWSASGKVLNAARAVSRLCAPQGTASRALTVLGGPAGDAMAAALTGEGLAVGWVKSATASRVCTTVIDRSDGSITELVENAGPVAAGELEEFRRMFLEEAPAATAIVLTGSLPSGTPADYYHSLLVGARAPVILDARGPELLAALEHGPFLVKPNREELAKTTGKPIQREEDLRSAMIELGRRGAAWVLVSQGRDAVWAHGQGKFYRFRPPRVEAVNPIGSGDCLAAGIAVAIARSEDPLEAIRFGIAGGAENAAVLLPADLDPAKVEARRAEVAFEEFGAA